MKKSDVALRDIVFDAVDGEAYTDKKGHHYNLLVASCYDTGWKQSWDSLQVGMPQLPTWAVFRALMELGRAAHRVHVAFYFSYDVTKWLQDWSPELRTQLWKEGNATWTTPHGRKYIVTYLPHKMFSIRSFDAEIGKNRSVTIFDVFGFFQCSFVKALKNWGLTEEIEFIEKMKAERSLFKSGEMDTITKYSLMETDLLCQLMNRVRDALAEENIPLRKWLGAGSIAEALLHREDMQMHISVPAMTNEGPFLDACLGAYFGGRFELFKQGVIDASHQYDINSAYPSAMCMLPSFLGAQITRRRNYNPDAKYSLWYVTYSVPQSFPIGPLPYRTKSGSIIFPHANRYGVWVHQVELETAIRLYGNSYFTIHYGYEIVPHSGRSVYGFIPELAKRRLALKKQNDQRNIVLKLGLNSLYGKTAQSIGNAGNLPPFQNFFIAGYITAATRAKLLDFAFGCGVRGSGIIMFATDGIFSLTPHETVGTKTSEKLGGWEYTEINKPVLYLKPGVYFTQKVGAEDARATKRRTRGFRAARFTSDDVFREWRKNGPFGILDADDDRFVGIGSCLVNRDWTNYGRFVKMPMEIRFGPGPTKWYKFGHEIPIGRGEQGQPGISKPDYYVLVPYQRKVDRPSKLYERHWTDKVFTLDKYDEETRAEMVQEISYMEQPDYEKYLGFGEGTE